MRLGLLVAASLLSLLAGATAVGEEQDAAPGEPSAPAEPAPPTPDDDFALLVGHGFAVARDALEAAPQFDPFALVIRDDGRLQHVSPPEGETGRSPDDLAETLYRGLRHVAGPGNYRAVAIFTDIVIAQDGAQTDAVHAAIEHREGLCANVYQPYRRGTEGRSAEADVAVGDANVALGDAVTTPREGAVFAGCARLPEPEG